MASFCVITLVALLAGLMWWCAWHIDTEPYAGAGLALTILAAGGVVFLTDKPDRKVTPHVSAPVFSNNEGMRFFDVVDYVVNWRPPKPTNDHAPQFSNDHEMRMMDLTNEIWLMLTEQGDETTSESEG